MVNKEGNPCWIAKAVCDIFGIVNTTIALAGLDDDEKSELKESSSSGGHKPFAINEPGLYILILRSRKPAAKKFKCWVTHEVIPTIRKTGGDLHVTESMTDLEILVRGNLVAQKYIKQLHKQVADMTLKVKGYELVNWTSSSRPWSPRDPPWCASD